MPLVVRRREEVFHIRRGWFEGYWHFSFGVPPDGYYDPANTGFGLLRVFNVDTLAPGAVWPLHPHRDIEVVTYCVEGEFRHADSLGNDGVLYPGDVQHTTIGRGLWHSEINHRQDRPMTFIQVWVTPRLLGLPPSVEQRHVRPEERLNRFLPLVSSRDPSALPIHADAEAFAATLEPGVSLEMPLEPGFGAYLYLISGRARVQGREIKGGDALKVWEEEGFTLQGVERSETFLVVVRL